MSCGGDGGRPSSFPISKREVDGDVYHNFDGPAVEQSEPMRVLDALDRLPAIGGPCRNA